MRKKWIEVALWGCFILAGLKVIAWVGIAVVVLIIRSNPQIHEVVNQMGIPV